MVLGCFSAKATQVHITPKPTQVHVVPKPDAVTVRTSLQPAVPPGEALQQLKEGNQRYVGASGSAGQVVRTGLAEQRRQLVEHGQKPMAAVFGCADSRAPIDTIFDATPGDLFIVRNAGNTCTRAEGSVVGSLEYAISHLDTKLILVLGHTKCGALAGATKTMLAQRCNCEDNREGNSGALVKEPSTFSKGQSALEILLAGLVPVAKQVADTLPGATEQQIAAKMVRVNVHHTVSRLFQYSPVLRRMVASGEVQVHGGVYDLETGEVEFMGQHPSQDELLTAHLEVAETHQPTHDGLELNSPMFGA